MSVSAADAAAAGGRARRVARNTGWSLVGVVVPFAAGLLTIPILTEALGPARFGLIGLAWAVLEYLALLDAGLGRATVHLVAQRLRAREGVPGDVVTASVLLQLVLGGLGGLLLAAAAPLLATSVLKVPAALRGETHDALLVLAATVPFVLLGIALRGVLEAAERFDAAAAVRVPASTATFVVPAVLAVGGASVPEILAALLVVRLAACAATLVLVRRCVPAVRWSRPASWSRVRPLLTFGGWVAVSNVLSPIFLLLDRLVLGIVVGVVAVGYYTGPYEAVVRLLVLPAAVAAAVFPQMSALAAGGDESGGALAAYYATGMRVLALPMLALAAVGLVLAPDLVGAWLGPTFAAETSVATRLLLVGVTANAIAHLPFAAVQAVGRPDVTARLHVVEAALHVPLTVLLVHRWGIEGAAAAWALRASVDAVLVSHAAHRLLRVGWRTVVGGRGTPVLLAVIGTVAATAALQAAVRATEAGGGALLVGAVAIGLGFAAVAWCVLLAPDDRRAARAALRRDR